ncbi:MAG TPA: hypothetical protein VNI01_12175, partial [Elusimicrobiota bacterium]|nr:hypothetical protein [Elusimicrobiota bacterium]
MSAALLLAALLAAAPRAGAEESAPEARGAAIDNPDEQLARTVASQLASNPNMAQGLAARILDSRVTEAITASKDQSKAFQEVRDWVQKNPVDAAHLAIGFAQDDADGTQNFENTLFERIERHFRLNPDRYNGMYGKLHEMAGISKSLARSAQLTDDARKEHIQAYFDGLAGQGATRSLTGNAPGADDGGAVHAGIATGELYDHLSASNPTGFSPEIMALQSQLNASRPPGSPKLIPTGKLDLATLRFPVFGLRHALEVLQETMRAQRAYLQAKALGLPVEGKGRAQWDTPDGQLALDQKAAFKDPLPSFARRKDLLAKAADAVDRFDQIAAQAKNPKWISAKGLGELSAARQEATRWITAASLEEKLYRLESCRGFLTPALLDAIARAPVSEDSRRLYLARGKAMERAMDAASEELKGRVAALSSDPRVKPAQAAALSAA